MTSVALAEHSVSSRHKSARTAATTGTAKAKKSASNEVPITCCGIATLLITVMGDPRQDHILPKEHRGISRDESMKLLLASFNMTEPEIEKLVSLRKQIDSAPKVNMILRTKKKQGV